MVKLFNNDCIEGMKNLADNSIDCIITDLPFNATACDWDKTVIDLSKMWEQFKRIIKPCSSVLLFANGKFVYKLVNSNVDWFKYKWVWVKDTPTMFIHAKNAPMRKFEEILVFSDGVINHATVTKRRMKYNPQGLTSCEKSRTGRGKAMGTIVGKRPSQVDNYIQKQTGYPTDVIYYSSPHGTTRLHPSQKPTELLEFLIKTYTDEGDVVLDATMGSGSTGVAALNAKRNFIGYEIDEKYFNIAKERISKSDTALQ